MCLYSDIGCSEKHAGRGLCDNHYKIVQRRGQLENFPIKTYDSKQCDFEGCDKIARSCSAQYCEAHYYRIRRNGNLELKVRQSTGQCLQCGVECNSVYCSGRCATRGRRNNSEDTRYCRECSAKVPPTRYSTAVYCSKKCNRVWRYKNDPEYKEKVLISAANQRAKRKNKANGTFSLKEWRYVLSFYGRKCLRCGTVDNITKDHVVPLARGGTNTFDNLQPLCNFCNISKSAKTIDYRWDHGVFMAKQYRVIAL